jgi:hypothetical protein
MGCVPQGARYQIAGGTMQLDLQNIGVMVITAAMVTSHP